jgi:V8-like Glu-specific endopeptidase
MLQLALKASQAVVRIALPKGTGSGFIVGDNLVMTNHHVLGDQGTADASQYEFGYQIGPDGNPQLPQSRQAKAAGLFHTNVDLDFSVAELESIPDDIEPLLLKPERPQKETRVSIIQHPGGAYKMISMQNNFIAFANAKVLQYTTSTMPGSSGSPVFNDDFAVIAIHHSGGLLLEPGSNQKYLRNAGTSMIAVLDDLRQNAADIYARINHS